VPAILHRGALVTEQVAIFVYLADLFPESGLAPAIGDPRRGPYLRWLVYYAACYEPALVDRFMKNAPAPQATSPYGDFETMLGTVAAQLAEGPYLLGEAVSAADILWGGALHWGLLFKLIPGTATIADYVSRITSRPAAVSVAALDAELATEQAKAAAEAP